MKTYLVKYMILYQNSFFSSVQYEFSLKLKKHSDFSEIYIDMYENKFHFYVRNFNRPKLNRKYRKICLFFLSVELHLKQ